MHTQKCSLCGFEAGFFTKAKTWHYFHCKVCYLIFLTPKERLNQDEELKRYSSHQNHPDDFGYRAFLNQVAEPLYPLLPANAEGLDFGCGPGPALSVMFQEHGFKMKVYDPFFAPDETVLQQSYDFMTCTETAEHFFFPGKEFARFDKMLRCGGWLGVMTKMHQIGQDFQNWYYMKDPTHVSFYSIETMGWIAQRYQWEMTMPSENVAIFHKPHLKEGESICLEK